MSEHAPNPPPEPSAEERGGPQSPPVAGDHHWLGVLRHRHFRNIWIAAFGSSIGGWMEMVGVQWVMAEIATDPNWRAAGNPGPTLMMAYLGAAQLGPTLVLGIFGGLLADRVNRKNLLFFTQAILMLVAATLAGLAAADMLTASLLLVISLVNGITMAFNAPAWQVLTPRLVPRSELTKAITLNGIQFNMARVVGPALAGMILHASKEHGAAVLFSVNTASFLGVLLAVAATPDSPAPPREANGAWAQTREAGRFLFGNRGPFRVLLALVLFAMLAAPLMRMLPIFVKEVYNRGEEAFGNLLAVMGAGAVLGGLALKYLPPWYPKHHFIPLSLALGGLSVALFSATSDVYVAGAIIFFCGVFWLWSFNSSIAALQLLVEDRMRGRVMAMSNTLVFGAMPLGGVIAGLIGEVVAGRADDGFGTQVGVGSLAVVLMLAGIAMLIWRTPEVDGIAPGEPGYERRPGLLRGLTAAAHRPVLARSSPQRGAGV